MSVQLRVWKAERLVGILTVDGENNRYSLEYESTWVESGSPLSPNLPLIPLKNTTLERHSADVRIFFENLLPEGKALEDAALANRISKSNVAGLLHALGRESAGALMFSSMTEHPYDAPETPPRRLTKEELSTRIRSRDHESFNVWDGKVRLSIAGYQDKLAVIETDGAWYLPETARQSTTTILKPEPIRKNLAGMTTNEFMCMQLAEAVGLPVAETSLIHLPEPVLVIKRFDRYLSKDSEVTRIQCIDGCQALGLPMAFKYERPHYINNHSHDTADIRDGASLPMLFELMSNRELMKAPGPNRLQFLRWIVFQVLIGNTDAHAKNLTFFSDEKRLSLAPTYDLVSNLALTDETIDDEFAMAIGDNFDPRSIRAYDWAYMAHTGNISSRLMLNVLTALANQCLKKLPAVRNKVLSQGGDNPVVERVSEVVASQCDAALKCAQEISKIPKDMF